MLKCGLYYPFGNNDRNEKSLNGRQFHTRKKWFRGGKNKKLFYVYFLWIFCILCRTRLSTSRFPAFPRRFIDIGYSVVRSLLGVVQKWSPGRLWCVSDQKIYSPLIFSGRGSFHDGSPYVPEIFFPTSVSPRPWLSPPLPPSPPPKPERGKWTPAPPPPLADQRSGPSVAESPPVPSVAPLPDRCSTVPLATRRQKRWNVRVSTHWHLFHSDSWGVKDWRRFPNKNREMFAVLCFSKYWIAYFYAYYGFAFLYSYIIFYYILYSCVSGFKIVLTNFYNIKSNIRVFFFVFLLDSVSL